MKDVTIKTIGWTIFGVCFLIMFYGMFIALSISNMDSEFRTVHTINMDNETKDAIISMADMSKEEICKEELTGLHNCLYYEPTTNTFYNSVCYLINTSGAVLK